LARCGYFMRAQVWPREIVLNPEGWLTNFRTSEIPHAVHLLNAFMYFAAPLVKEMFASSFQSLSRCISAPGESIVTLQSSWRTLIARSLITYVTGETESPADSGHIFVRLVRDYLGVPEHQIKTPQNALVELFNNGPRPVIFVDDFVGSGQQFLATWNRPYPLPGGVTHSFKSIAAIRPAQFYYSTILATSVGVSLIRSQCPGVIVTAAHELDPRYSVLHPDCFLWPEALRPTAAEFVRTASLRGGMPDDAGNNVNDWQGFHGLGLALAFEHGVPDATIAMLRWTSNNWQPLILVK
jgi:hypothetical protein